ncbi:MAG: protoheme IX farnesyltransferase [Alphaproteobacteria bacterium]|nr:protoheme IX farnesyltransferase [Alphaproteobacteria bacterium]
MTDTSMESLALARGRSTDAAPGDYVALLKPRVMSLSVFTSLIGLLIAPGAINPVLAAVSILAIAVGAGAAGALNMWYDADIDAVMSRTRGRPIPRGLVAREEALAFGLFLSVFAVLTLWLAAGPLAAGLLAFTIFFYVVVYTMGLKRSTPQNIVIGGAAGALPPVIGWAAATGSLALEPLVLFAIIFLWTPPHFWALALVKEGDYARAGIPMMPNVAGAPSTRRQIVAYAVLLLVAALSPLALGFAGALYGLVALLGGGAFLALALALARAGARADRSGESADRMAEALVARRLFGFSILHLFALFLALGVEALAGLPALSGGVGL